MAAFAANGEGRRIGCLFQRLFGLLNTPHIEHLTVILEGIKVNYSENC